MYLIVRIHNTFFTYTLYWMLPIKMLLKLNYNFYLLIHMLVYSDFCAVRSVTESKKTRQANLSFIGGNFRPEI
jgi:hypothetical protein